MAQSVGQIGLDLVVNKNGFEKQMAGITGLAKKAGAALAAAFAVKKLISFGKQCIELGSDLAEVQNVVDVTFPAMSAQIDSFAKNAVSSFGLSETMAKKFTGTFGAMSKAFGFAEKEAYDMSTTLTGLAGDVASFYNISQEEAYTKLKSVFTGETESLKDLGVVMTQAALDSFALANGFGKTTAKMSEAEKVALRYRFVQEKLAAASGDFIRTSDGWANQVRVLKLQFDSLKASIGQGLINLLTPVIKVINTIIGKLAVLAEGFKIFTERITGKKASENVSSGMKEAAGASASMSGNVESAEKSAKKLAKTLLSVDNINLLSDNSGSGSGEETGGTAGGATGSFDFGDSSGVLDTINEKADAFARKLEKAFEPVKKIITDFKMGDFFQAGKDVSGLVKDLFDFVAKAIDKVDWYGIGKKIGDFLRGIDWTGVLGSVGNLIWQAIKAAVELWAGSFSAAPIETTIITAIALLKWTGLGKALCAGMLTSLTEAFISVGGITGLMTTDLSVLIGAGSFAEIGLTIATGIIAAIATAIAGFKLGEWINELITGEKIDMSWSEQFDEIKRSFSDGTWKDALSLWGKDIADSFALMGEEIAGWWNQSVVPFFEGIPNWFESHVTKPITDFFSNMGQGLKDIWENIKSSITNKINEIKAVISLVLGSIKNIFTNIWNGIKNTVTTVISGIKNGISSGLNQIKGTFTSVFTSIKNTVTNIFTNLWNGLKGIINSIIGGVEGMANRVIDGINGMIRALNGFSFDVPDWVPMIGGGKFGFSIPELKNIAIPRLAQGGYVKANTPQLAMIGDNRHQGEIVAPEDKIYQVTMQAVTDALKQLAGMLAAQPAAYADTGDIIIPVYVGGNKIDEIIITAQDRRNFRSGKNGGR